MVGIFLQEEDLKQFRQWGSRTPGHPENFETAGIEVTTGRCQIVPSYFRIITIVFMFFGPFFVASSCS